MKTDQAEPQDRRKKMSGPSSHWTLMILFVYLLLDLLGFTVILPLIPSLLEYYGRADQVRGRLLACIIASHCRSFSSQLIRGLHA